MSTQTLEPLVTKASEDKGALAYRPQLDALRAFAVGLVLFYHWIRPHFFVNLGHLGVTLFFVLSGFLITQILLNIRPESQTSGRGRLGEVGIFYVRRFLRIFPVYYLTLFATFFAGFAEVRATFFWHATYLSNLLLSYWPGSLQYVSHFWSLAVEEQFYLIWPWLIVFLPVRFLPSALVGIITAAPLLRLIAFLVPDSALGGIPLHNFDPLAVGALFAYLGWKAKKSGQSWTPGPRLNLIAIIALLGFLGCSVGRNTSADGVRFLEDSFAGLFLVWLVLNASIGFKGTLGRVLENPVLVYLGKISYGIYIFHNFMGMILVSLSKHCHPLVYVRAHPYLRFVVLSVMTVAIASASWFLFERPINNLKRYFTYGGRVVRPRKSPDGLAAVGDSLMPAQ